MDCFAEPVIGLAEGETGWFAMTKWVAHSRDPFARDDAPSQKSPALAGSREDDVIDIIGFLKR
jgi:hypothetical protein